MAQLSVQAHPPPAYPDAGAIDTTQEGLDRFDPQQRPEMKTALLTEAQLLYRAAKLPRQADRGMQALIATLLDWAIELQSHPSVTAEQVRSLALSLQRTPQGLRDVAGHLGACDTAQEQLDRFRKDLASPATNESPAAQSSPALLQRMAKTQLLIRETYGLLKAGELSLVRELAKTIQKDIRDFDEASLAHKGKVAPTSRLGRGDVRAAAKQRSELEQRLRASALRQQLDTASEKLFRLESQVTKHGSAAAASKPERTWALTTRNGLLRKERAALNKASTSFKDDAAGSNKAQAAIVRVRDRIASVRKQLVNLPER